MKIYLLDIDKSMTDEWEKEFGNDYGIEIVNDNFKHFMDTHEDIDGIVSPANSFGIMDGGYDKAIINYLGENAQTNVYTILDLLFDGYQPIGTSCPISFYKYTILHTPTMRYPEEIIDKRVIFDCMYNCLVCAKKANLKSIVIPAFGACTGKVPRSTVAKLMHLAYDVFINQEACCSWRAVNNIRDSLNKILDEDINNDLASSYNNFMKTAYESLNIPNEVIGHISTDDYITAQEANSLKSLEEYVKDNEHIQKQVSGMMQDYSEPKYKCPKCGGNVRKNLTIVLTSYPPKFRYECDNCNHIDYHEF